MRFSGFDDEWNEDYFINFYYFSNYNCINLISIIVIIKYRNKGIGIQIFALILISVASQFVSGNAPSSIMFYPEYPGRYWIIFNGILMIIIGLLIYDLLENWEFSINKLQK